MTWVTTDDLTHRIDAGYYQPVYVEMTHKLRQLGKLSDLGTIAPKMSNGPHGGVSYVDGAKGVLYIRAKNIHELSVNQDDPVYISREDHEQNKRAAVRPSDILITITGANIGACGVVPEDIKEANIIQSLAKVRIGTDDDPYYVAAFLDSAAGQLMIRRESVNTAREGLNFEYLAGIPVLLSESAVQRAIGYKIRKAERLRKMKATALASSNALLTELLGRRRTPVATVGDQNATWVPPSLVESRIDCNYNNPEAIRARDRVIAYKTSRLLREVSRKVVCGPFGSTLTSDEHDQGGEVVLVQPTDISGTFFAQPPGWRISQKTLEEKGLKKYPAGTLLFARVGIYPHCGVLPVGIPFATISSSMIAVLLKDDQDPYFYSLFFRSAVGLPLLFAIQKTTAQPTISTEELSTLRVPVPPPDIQALIGTKMREAESYHNEQISSLLAARADVEALITGTLNETRLLFEAHEIEEWLKNSADSRTKGRS